ncbi:hypothetical protein ACFVJW_00060 [Streptomyces libani]|uniref:hypothetical protein n=1 Tax=Streptomyces nigrescens TaxID=1920 RepID=UPI00363E5DE2
MGIVITAVAALAAGHPLGGCARGGTWAAGWPIRSASPGWHRREAVVVLVHVVTAPRLSWRVMRAPATATRVPAPIRDPDWAANRIRRDKGGAA